jgi:4'-phosphopantetheinyl transferase
VLLPELAAFEATLSEEELARMRRLRFAEDRARYAAGRGWLRRILGEETGRDPGELRFIYGPHGKPALDDGPAFNVAHTREHVAVALAPRGDVGVDIEAIADFKELPDLAARYFSPAQRRELAARMPERRPTSFACVWSVKEAAIKALGLGLAAPLEDLAAFDFPVEPGEGLVPLRVIPSAWGDPERWRACIFPVDGRTAGALVVRYT